MLQRTKNQREDGSAPMHFLQAIRLTSGKCLQKFQTCGKIRADWRVFAGKCSNDVQIAISQINPDKTCTYGVIWRFIERGGPDSKRPPGEEDPVGVVEYDRRLGGGVPSVKSERRWEEECAVSEYLSLYRAGIFIGNSRQRRATSALFVPKDRSFDVSNIVRPIRFVQCNKGMVAMRTLHGWEKFPASGFIFILRQRSLEKINALPRVEIAGRTMIPAMRRASNGVA
ncbi:hypothetical protein [Rhizobium sp.]